MRVAYYCPLKPPGHPNPSGDRRIARAIGNLVRIMGHSVDLASTCRSYNKTGSVQLQRSLEHAAALECRRISDRWRERPAARPDLWLTYHNYHKAPDLIGPNIKEIFKLPYVIIEPSHAPRQIDGPWRAGLLAAGRALGVADRLLAVTDEDRAGLGTEPDLAVKCELFPPFLDPLAFVEENQKKSIRRNLGKIFSLDISAPWLITVAMMRNDVKRQSYMALIDALASFEQPYWQWIVIGDGPAKEAIEKQAGDKLGGRARFLGRLDDQFLRQALLAADLFVWPAFREAYGMALLEAQAAGLPAIVCREGGVMSVIDDGRTGIAVANRDMSGFVGAVRRLLDDHGLRWAMARQARARVLGRHSIHAAKSRLARVFASLC